MSSRNRRRSHGRLHKLTRTDRQRKLARNQRRGRPAFTFANINGTPIRVPKLD